MTGPIARLLVRVAASAFIAWGLLTAAGFLVMFVGLSLPVGLANAPAKGWLFAALAYLLLALAALWHCWTRPRISPLVVLAAVLPLVPVLVRAWNDATPAPRISTTVPAVHGFDLVFDDPSAQAAFGLFETGYAIKAGYDYFTYRSHIYHSVGGGSVVIRPVAQSPARFVVRETAVSHEPGGRVRKSRLQVVDRRDGAELAQRHLVAHAVEDGTGWTGDHALKFVRSVLERAQTPGAPWTGTYPTVSAEVQLVRTQDTPATPLRLSASNCPGSLQVERRPSGSTLRGPDFAFLPASPLWFAVCNAGQVLVASGVFASNLNLDLLTLDGHHVGQGHVRLPLPLEAHWADLSGVELRSGEVRANLHVNTAARNAAPSAYGQVQVRARLQCRSPDCTP